MEQRHTVGWRVSIALTALVAVVGHVTVVRAEDRNVTTAEVAPDLSTARSAALAWIGASQAGDASVAHKILVDDEAQREFMASPLRFSAALRALESAAVKQFGEAGRQVTGYPDAAGDAREEKLQIKQEDDRATAKLRGAILPLQLRRIDGQWRVDLSEAVRDPRARRAGETSGAAAKVAEDVAVEIAEGKFKSAEEAKAAFRERRLAQVEK